MADNLSEWNKLTPFLIKAAAPTRTSRSMFTGSDGKPRYKVNGQDVDEAAYRAAGGNPTSRISGIHHPKPQSQPAQPQLQTGPDGWYNNLGATPTTEQQGYIIPDDQRWRDGAQGYNDPVYDRSTGKLVGYGYGEAPSDRGEAFKDEYGRPIVRNGQTQYGVIGGVGSQAPGSISSDGGTGYVRGSSMQPIADPTMGPRAYALKAKPQPAPAPKATPMPQPPGGGYSSPYGGIAPAWSKDKAAVSRLKRTLNSQGWAETPDGYIAVPYTKPDGKRTIRYYTKESFNPAGGAPAGTVSGVGRFSDGTPVPVGGAPVTRPVQPRRQVRRSASRPARGSRIGQYGSFG